ncbi:type I polyketide synthase [Streptomyces paromomycinus]|uniref:Hybrid non-ribosomal peptide synthetase/type I polyketide synthase n=1 Tax=Streptomyces paromomycinus TaxID=92743 RepID=A0A401VUN2_STREY|nr:type I polyketide synthase [Streptomyces paromomycinus]GCD40787.1 hybrid non-ribosomal peptide synthetase/type I polyketide synthase [Streptomyces paromomycinus]
MNNQRMTDDAQGTDRGAHEDVESIAVIGMAGRFPGARDPEEFWRNIAQGVESITRLSEDDLRRAGVDETQLRDPHYVRAASVLADLDRFDAEFFGLTPMEAAILDPQHRLLLECTQALFDNAGYNPDTLKDLTGVYVGVGFPSYLVHNVLKRPDVLEQAGMQRVFFATDKGFAPTRIAHKFNLTGPSIGVDTACSTSLVAVHQACRALLAYDCDLTVAGGASAVLPSGVGYRYEEGGIASPDGHCRAFDADAGGTLFGSGVGLVLLKRLRDALADGDHIHAVIRGSAVNNDGASKAGFTAPSVTGQAAVIAEALAFAGTAPETIGYVEAHGTGTVIGDPIEVTGLIRAYREKTDRRGFCALGSVKTNVGHLDVAAGVSGMIKAVQALRHAALPPSLNWKQPNPAIDFEGSPFYVNTELRPWPITEGPRRAGVSSFGIGGTNAHVVLEEAPPREDTTQNTGPTRPEQLVVVSARSPQALDSLSADLATAFRAAEDGALPDLAFTLSNGRRAYSHRRAVVCRDRTEAIATLGGAGSAAVMSGVHDTDPPRVAFLFPGQGAQRLHMLAALYEGEPVFRREVDRCAEYARSQLGVDLREVIYPSAGDEEHHRARLDETWIAQPALYTASLALARLWQAWGVVPSALLGHSLGEYAAATVSGVFRTEDALDLVIHRARAMHEMPPGAMLAATLDEDALTPLLGDCSLAAINDPQQCVASGPEEAIEELERTLTRQGVEHRRLRTSHAFHSWMLDDVAHAFEARVAQVPRSAPRLPMVSCLTGRVLDRDEVCDPGYWARQMRGTVRFADSVRTAAQDPQHLFLEAGPGRTLTPMVRRTGIDAERIVTSGRSGSDPRTDGEALLTALGTLYCAGVSVDWDGFWDGRPRRRVPLPGYPFKRRRHWIDPAPAAAAAQESTAAATGDAKSYVPVWRAAPLDDAAVHEALRERGRWLVVGDADGFADALARRLEAAGHEVVLARRSTSSALPGEGFVLDPARTTDIDGLLTALEQEGRLPDAVVLACARGAGEDFEAAQRDGLETAAAWVQVLVAHAAGQPVRLAVVADRLHAVISGDAPIPAKATLGGYCRAAAQGHPELAIGCLDVDADADAEAAAAWVVAETAVGLTDPVVAYRAGVRRTEAYEAVPDGCGGAAVREQGSYAVTGGLHGASAALARHLAAAHQARLTLLEPGPVPERADWPDWSDATTGPRRARAEATAEAGAVPAPVRDDVEALRAVERAAAASARPGPDRGLVEATLNRLCGGHVYRTLVATGVDLTPGCAYRRAEIAARMGLLPAFDKFLDFFLDVLQEDGIIRRSDASADPDRIEVVAGPEDAGFLDTPDALALLPGHEDTIAFLDHCVRHYPAALSGDTDAVGVLFPDGDPKPLETAFLGLLAASNYGVHAELLGRALARIAERSPERPLRILEVGGGNGQLTRLIAPLLRGHEVRYTFTDLGSSFVRRARQAAVDYGFAEMRCQVFDISRDPAAQGLDLYAFDAVIGFDVVHATPRIGETTANLRGLLAPGGLLCLVEAVVSLRWVEMLWGLAEGWWLFEDEEVRTRSPLVSLDTWDRVLGEQPFADVVTFPREEAARATTDYGLVLAQQPARIDTPGYRAHLERRAAEILAARRAHIDSVRALEAQGAEVLVVRADPAAREQLAAALAAARARFGTVDGILHAPPPGDESSVSNASPAELRSQVSVRARAALAVDAAAEAGVRHLALVSGRAAVTGGPDAPRSAALGAFFDALAATQRDDHRTCSVHWDEDGDASGAVCALGRTGIVVVSPEDPAAALAARAERRRRPQEGSSAPAASADDVEAELLVIFRQLFGTDDIGPDDDFQRMGGDSLLASQAIARIRRRFDVDLPVSVLFDAPTAAGLAAKVRQARGGALGGGAPVDVPLLHVPRDGALPLSFGQQALWLAEQFHGPSATYNIPSAVRLVGRLRTEVLRRALREVIQRHEVLRTTIHDVDGVPVQRVHEDVTVDLAVRKVRPEQIDDLAQEHARSVFDLEQGPLIRVALLRIDDEDHVLLVNIHHIVADGWSLGVLVHELVTLYASFVRDEPSPLPVLDYQYADFAQWQRRWLEGKVFETQLGYWRHKLAGLPPLLPLPTDRPRPDRQRIRNAVHRFVVTAPLARRLDELGRAEGATLFMVLLTAFKVLLSRYANTSDIAVGTTNANRTRAVFEQMIGMFVNNLVLRTDLAGNPAFRELLARVRTTAVDAYAHQDLPFLMLVDALRQERSPSHTPLFQVLFLLQKLNITLELPGISAHTIEVDALHTKFDLTLFMEEGDEGITGSFIYNAELFDASTVEGMSAHLVQILTSAVEAPDARIGSLRMETDDEARMRNMTEANSRTSKLLSLRSAKRRSVEITDINPVKTGFLPGFPQTPLVVEPAGDGADLPGWLSSNKELVESYLHRHGAVLLRGFHKGSVESFEAAAGAVCPTLFREYGDLPREGESARIYKSTPYPADQSILFHNESSHLHTWPMRQFFSCIVAPQEGGETPIVDCRTVYTALRRGLVEQFERKKLRYVRNFIESVDVSWQRFYGTDDPQEVEHKCAEAGMGFEWGPDGTLKTWRIADAVLRHPRTGEPVFFNQLALHHVSCLDPETRASLVELYGESGMPRNVYWGDGSVIEDEVVDEVREVMDRESLAFTWQEGDVLVIDNMLVAHSRRPFTGTRKIVVALGDMMSATEFAAGG